MGRVNPRSNPPNALDFLTAQHDRIEQLLAHVEDDALSREDKRLFLHALAEAIRAHAAIEEAIFYPAVHAAQTEEILLEPTEHHVAIKRTLADLLSADLDDLHFDSKLAVLEEELAHHTREEEEQILFPKLRRLLSEAQLAALGARLQGLEEALLATAAATGAHAGVTREARTPAPP